jgi:succinate dehydrogenase / fumarate reductase membrane anchor subunit
MSLRSPLARVLNHGAARDGVSHWWIQRVSAVALAPLCLWLAASLLLLPTRNHVIVAHWIGVGLHPVLLVLTVLLATWHAWLGLQVVIEDYVPQSGPRITLLLISTFTNALLAATGTYAVLRIALHGVA